MDLSSVLAALGAGGAQPANAAPTQPQANPQADPNAALQGWLQNMGVSGTPGNSINPALGLTMIRSPETVAGTLASQGVPPPADQPEGVGPDDATQSLGKALNPTPSQQGADEAPGPMNITPTPTGDSPNSTGAVPAPNTSRQGGAGQGTNVGAKTSNAVDDLGKTLAGLKPMPLPPHPNVQTPQAFHSYNQISRSNLPTALLQQMGQITRGSSGPYRLGQALAGVKNE
jgi:hypothetical protein